MYVCREICSASCNNKNTLPIDIVTDKSQVGDVADVDDEEIKVKVGSRETFILEREAERTENY